MAYLGNRPAESFASFEKQVFTIVNSQTAYTLSHSVTNENDIRLVVNNVVQEPGSGKAYTASGTTLTLSAALTNGTDEMYCVFLGRALQTVNPPNASVGTAQLGSDAVTEAKIADGAVENEHLNVNVITGQTAETSIATDDTVLIHDTSAGALRKMTRTNFVSGVGGANTPAFHADLSGNQNINSATTTKIEINSEVFDTDSDYDNSTNYRFTPTTAGKYFVYLQARFSWNSGNNNSAFLYIYKNGSAKFRAAIQNGANWYGTLNCYGIVDMNGSSDYLEAFGNYNASLPMITAGGDTHFGAYRIII